MEEKMRGEGRRDGGEEEKRERKGKEREGQRQGKIERGREGSSEKGKGQNDYIQNISLQFRQIAAPKRHVRVNNSSNIFQKQHNRACTQTQVSLCLNADIVYNEN